ncbi:SDR family oxidoreductase [Sphingomonas bacterium]|uniref:SDR family oxidoreductase n=1 Tax=Sphingomonas bacterium TaxID=1895847 RepID=UPI0015772898|nr:SDR family oxidoreductase [Sphingomonas bacterium]
MRSFDLIGKVAVVTGSSRGIGRAIAGAIAEAGGTVVVSSRKQTACDAAAAEINAALGAERAIAIAASISDKAALQAMIDETRARLGPIDILVCNAATNPYYGPLLEIGDAEFRKVLENNVLASHWLVQMVAPDMIERRGGAIIVVSSIGGLLGSDLIGAYNISKAADFQLVRNLAVELGRHRIRVNAIAPGTIRTDFARALYEDPKTEAELNRATPLGRIGEPGDIAGAAVFLASEAGAYMTGQAVVIDGGFTIGRTSA